MSSGSDSEVTDIDDGDYKAASGPKKSGAGSQKSTYKIRHALKVPRATTYTAQALYDQIHSSDIDLEPEYQRDVVWPETKQIGIIDSIFRNFYIPPVIFAVKVDEDGSESRICIDGKQRLTSIHRFMDGLIPHRDLFTNEKLYYKDIEGGSKRKRTVLPEKYRRLFSNKQIVCVEYQDITDSDERDIFQRVQLGMALTPAEKLQVSSSPRANFIRELQVVYLREGALVGDALDWDRSRGADFRSLAQALFTIDNYPSHTSAGTIPQIEKWLNQSDEPDEGFYAKIHQTFSVFVELVQDQKLNRVFRKPGRVSPIEFILICLLIAVHKDRLSLAQLSTAIGLMREDVRREHVDIRMNSRVAKTMIEFIKELKSKKLEGAGESAGLVVGQKRKREDEDKSRSGKRSAITSSKSVKTSSISHIPPPPPKSPPVAPTIKQESNVVRMEMSPIPAAGPPAPPSTDRLAGMRAAKDAHGPPRSIPSVPPALRRLAASESPMQQSSSTLSSNAALLENSIMSKMLPDMPQSQAPRNDHPNSDGAPQPSYQNGSNGIAIPYDTMHSPADTRRLLVSDERNRSRAQFDPPRRDHGWDDVNRDRVWDERNRAPERARDHDYFREPHYGDAGWGDKGRKGDRPDHR